MKFICMTIHQILKEKKLKVTRSRVAILRIFTQHKTPLDIQMIIKYLGQANIQADMQAEQMRGQITSQVEQFKAQQEMMLAEQRLAFDRWKAELEAQTKIQIAQIQAGSKTEAAMVAAMNKSEQVDG